jgi:hypothetical protein
VLNHKGPPVIDPALPDRPTRDSHPRIKFWTIKDYEHWLDTPEAQVTQRGKEPYLKEETGEPVSSEKLTNIRAYLRSIWAELANLKRAPQTWGELDASSRELFRSRMERAYPLFKCAEGHWKLECLARSNYPAWRAHYIDKDGNWLTKEARKLKRKFKIEEGSLPSSKRQKVGATLSLSSRYY